MINQFNSLVNTPYFFSGCAIVTSAFMIVKISKVVFPILKIVGEKIYYSRFFTALVIPFNSNHVNDLTYERNLKNKKVVIPVPETEISITGGRQAFRLLTVPPIGDPPNFIDNH